MKLNLQELTEKVRALAVETGSFIRQERSRFSRERVEKKHAHDYVSYVDKESERRIVACLRELLPEAGFIVEEGSAGFSGEPYCWVVDPLDGTTNFIHDNAPYCVSIALRDREEILIGVVYEICRDECFWTCKGDSSYRNGEPVHVSDVDCADNAFLALGLPYDADAYRPVFRKLVDGVYGKVAGTRVVGAAAAEMCYVACGRFDARVEALLGPWDIAAGILIVQNAGGRVTDFCGGDSYEQGSQVVASNGKMHDFLLKILAGS